ncbi:S9 family peptidase [Fulvivirga sp. M361]|uniref:prolyl oligopeptidase family serine peptidase n=1 Tax=Fulvivirga sp. M361 TaxID=2594266 RepID=UPI00117A20FF|nr:prolyl oligopeptidase family serine peptidase [Fulvivirga sp. M361]TRX61276.1 S9 family peptidase [Fulvivirga sp. M361]
MDRLVHFLILVTLFGACSKTEPEQSFLYPTSDKVDTVDTYFGTEIPDPYRWLEDDNSDETAKWVQAQNKLTFDYLSDIPFREKIKSRLETLFNYERISAPSKHGDYLYFYRNDGLQNQNVLLRKPLEGSDEEVFLDPNGFKEDGTISLGGTSFSDDGSLFGYLISEGGSDWRKAIVIKTGDRSQVGDTLRHIKFSGLSWLNNDGFYYARYDAPEEGKELSGLNTKAKLMYHKMGTPQSADEMIFEPEGEKVGVNGYLTEDNRFLVITTFQGTSGNQLFIKDLTGSSEIITAVDHFDNDHQVIDVYNGRLLVETNLEAPNYRVVAVDPENPLPENWVDVIPETDQVLSAATAGGFIFTDYLEDAKTAIKQHDMEGKLVRNVALPGIGTAYGFSGKQADAELYYTFTSFTYPPTIFKYDLATGSSELYESPQVDFNPEDYETRQVFYDSKDGTKVPMFIVHKKGLTLDGTNPTYLYAYGGFNISLKPSFSTQRILWLENGGIYAQPNIRGGGEYGEKWHEAGTKMQKQNVFDDFIAAGEYLIANQYTSSDYLAIAGGSNGGLLVGATMTQRPDLMKVAFPAVGVMDMLRYHKFTIGWAWATDYGTSEDSKEMFEYLKGYSPVHNLRSGTSYPATMVTTADHDDRVVPAHSFKYAATLQEHQAGEDPVLIRIETDAGHGAGTPISKRIEQVADIYSFAWYNMGVIPPLAKEAQ